MLKKLGLAAVVAVLVVGIGWQLASQEEARPAPRRERMTPEQMRERMQQMRQRVLEGLKEQLKCGDEEWQAVGPAIEKVQETQQELRGYGGSRMFMFGGARRAREGQEARRPRPGAEESPLAPLQKLAEQDKPAAGQVKAALAKFRAERDAKREELKKRQKFLQEIVTPRQELVLVLAGILD
jgi:Spy/CpxP family protein refolding chaperone